MTIIAIVGHAFDKFDTRTSFEAIREINKIFFNYDSAMFV